MERLSVDNPFSAAPIWYVDSTDTTMRLAREAFAMPGGGSGTVAAAGYQEQGRGRDRSRSYGRNDVDSENISYGEYGSGSGRRWESSPGESLMLTLALEPSAVRFPVQLLPLLTGLGVSRFIAESWGLETFVKWPNDLLSHGRKLSGVLCESSRSCLLVGIGINIIQTRFSNELMRRIFPPTSILLERGGDRMDFKPGGGAEYCRLVGGLLRALYDTYAADDWELQLTRRLWGIGQPVVFHTGAADSLGAGNHVSGILRGLSPDGGLRIDDRVFYAGEIRSFGSGGFQV